MKPEPNDSARQEKEERKRGRRAMDWVKKLPNYATEDGLGRKLDELTLDEDIEKSKLRQWFARRWDAKHLQRTKLILSTFLWVIALMVKVFTGGTVTSLMLVGMSLCWVGNALWIEYAPVRKWVRQYYLWGAGFFAMGQCLYIAAMAVVYEHTETHSIWLFALSLVMFLALTVLLLYNYVLSNRRQPLVLRFLFSINGMLLCVLGAFGVTLCIATAGRGFVMLVGAVFFYVAGTLHCGVTFGTIRLKNPHVWVWLSYLMTQLCLLFGAGILAGGL